MTRTLVLLAAIACALWSVPATAGTLRARVVPADVPVAPTFAWQGTGFDPKPANDALTRIELPTAMPFGRLVLTARPGGEELADFEIVLNVPFFWGSALDERPINAPMVSRKVENLEKRWLRDNGGAMIGPDLPTLALLNQLTRLAFRKIAAEAQRNPASVLPSDRTIVGYFIVSSSHLLGHFVDIDQELRDAVTFIKHQIETNPDGFDPDSLAATNTAIDVIAKARRNQIEAIAAAILLDIDSTDRRVENCTRAAALDNFLAGLEPGSRAEFGADGRNRLKTMSLGLECFTDRLLYNRTRANNLDEVRSTIATAEGLIGQLDAFILAFTPSVDEAAPDRDAITLGNNARTNLTRRIHDWDAALAP